MKLIHFGSPDNEKHGVILEVGRRIDVSAFGADYNEFLFGGGGMMIQ